MVLFLEEVDEVLILFWVHCLASLVTIDEVCKGTEAVGDLALVESEFSDIFGEALM